MFGKLKEKSNKKNEFWDDVLSCDNKDEWVELTPDILIEDIKLEQHKE